MRGGENGGKVMSPLFVIAMGDISRDILLLHVL